jgi:hypothetical protein
MLERGERAHLRDNLAKTNMLERGVRESAFEREKSAFLELLVAA